MFPLFLSGLATRELSFQLTSTEKPSSFCKFVYLQDMKIRYFP